MKTTVLDCKQSDLAANILHELLSSTESDNNTQTDCCASDDSELFQGKKIEDDLWTPKSTKLLSDQDFGCELSIDDLMAEPGKVDTDTDEEIIIDDKPIFEGSQLTIAGALVLVLSLSIKHSLSADALSNILVLLHVLMPPGTWLCKSLYKFKKFFTNIKSPIVYHPYCSYCYQPVQKIDKVCPSKHCLKDLSLENSKSYFIELPIVQQLSTFFKRPGFLKDIQHRFKRRKTCPNAIEDIYDGNLYSELFKNNGMLSYPNNISFMLNTDGVPVFKSSNFQLWPLYLVINELEPSKRFLNENIIFAGLWYGQRKPLMWLFLKPTFESLLKLEHGIDFKTDDNKTITVKGILLSCTSDLPAKCLLCGSMQYNGHNGCWKCLQRGETFSGNDGQRGTWTYPFSDSDPTGPARTHHQVLDNAKQAMNSKTDVNGVKHWTWFHKLNYFDLVKGVGIDYMHGICLGVVKLLIHLWFSAEFKTTKFSIHNYVGIIDRRISEIKPTVDISRVPRSIAKDLKHWKASEFRSFLLYYGIPLLADVLPQKQLQHFTLLVHATAILLSDSITATQLDQVEQMLIEFCRQFPIIYGGQFMFYNVHQLLHLAQSVRDLGPLWAQSCFPFEDKNRFLLKLIHGTQRVEWQILSAVSLVQRIPELASKVFSTDPCSFALYKMLTASKRTVKAGTKVFPDIFYLGASYIMSIDTCTMNALVTYLGHLTVRIDAEIFDRMKINSSIIHGETYKKVSRRDSTNISFRRENGSIGYGKVVFFFKYCDNDAELYLAAVKEYNVIMYREDSHLIIVQNLQNGYTLKVVDVRDILHNLFVVSFSNCHVTVLTGFPNKIEGD